MMTAVRRQREHQSRGQHGARGLVSRFARTVAALLLVAFGWRVSAAFISPCSQDDDAPESAVTQIAQIAQAAQAGAAATGHGGDGCCPGKTDDHEGASPAKDAPGDDGDCNCPIHCGDCCDGAVMHALPTEVPAVVLGYAELIELPATSRPSARRNANPRGILHVPRMS